MKSFFGQKPNLTDFRIVGCLCFARNMPTTDKFAPRAIKSVFTGYSSVQKVIYVMIFKTKNSL